jgi:hypothetical protein
MMSIRPRRTMMTKRHKWILPLVCLLAWAAAPLAPSRAMAQELEIDHDARYEGYGEKVVVEEGSAAMTWVGFTFLCAITLLGLFKDAKRTHLD